MDYVTGKGAPQQPMSPEFPVFKTLELADRPVVEPLLRQWQPQASEYTFTNLFIWRNRYRVRWSLRGPWLLFLCQDRDGRAYGLQPVGPRPEAGIVRQFLSWMADQAGTTQVCIQRAEERWADVLQGVADLIAEPDEDQFDYVYRTADLIHLAGRKYHSRRNHVNRALRELNPVYEPLQQRYVRACMEVTTKWCARQRCCDDLGLLDEWEAVGEALRHLPALAADGGVVLIDGVVQAFAIGALLNPDTAVVHVEKANPEMPSLFALINQQFCAHRWAGVPFVNREQDLGDPGLRRAKQSYHPHHMVRKFRLRFK